jgi:hypothetical protein
MAGADAPHFARGVAQPVAAAHPVQQVRRHDTLCDSAHRSPAGVRKQSGCGSDVAKRTLADDVDDEPELYIVRPPDPGDGWRAERERIREQSRRRHLERMEEALALADAYTDAPRQRAEAVLDGFFGGVHRDTGDRCGCSCHPQLPETDLHDYGADCSCRHTAEERRARWLTWQAEQDAFWASSEGRQIATARQAEEDALASWLAAQSGVVVTSHGGWAPEQWHGSVDGHTFYFRERHDHWHIELDLAPSGRFARVWRGGDPTDAAALDSVELDEGEVVAEGTTAADGYGDTPLERARFLVDTIRTHLRRRGCTTHTAGRAELEQLLGGPAAWCPACGLRM